MYQQKYYGTGDNQYRIILKEINHELFLQEEAANTVLYRYTLYEPSYYMLSYGAIPVDNYYNGWIINVSHTSGNYSSLISDYQGKDRKIIAKNLPGKLDDSYKYELFEITSGVMSDTLKLSNDSSNIKNYYVGWTLSTMNGDDIDKTSTITAYSPYNKSITLEDTGIITDSSTKYKLYFNSENSLDGSSIALLLFNTNKW